MALNLGASPIDGAMLGSNQVDKIMLGTDEVWSSSGGVNYFSHKDGEVFDGTLYTEDTNESTLMVYEISNVKKILDSINFKESEFVENWIIEVRYSLFAMNEEKYNDLINQIG